MENTRTLVAAAVLVQDDHVMIARRPEGDPLGGYWEFPGGKIEPGEAPTHCLLREFQEEFGMDIEVNDFLGSVDHQYENSTVKLITYWATPLGHPTTMEAHSELAWVSKEDLSHYEMAPADRPIVEWVQRQGLPTLSKH